MQHISVAFFSFSLFLSIPKDFHSYLNKHGGIRDISVSLFFFFSLSILFSFVVELKHRLLLFHYFNSVFLPFYFISFYLNVFVCFSQLNFAVFLKVFSSYILNFLKKKELSEKANNNSKQNLCFLKFCRFFQEQLIILAIDCRYNSARISRPQYHKYGIHRRFGIIHTKLFIYKRTISSNHSSIFRVMAVVYVSMCTLSLKKRTKLQSFQANKYIMILLILSGYKQITTDDDSLYMCFAVVVSVSVLIGFPLHGSDLMKMGLTAAISLACSSDTDTFNEFNGIKIPMYLLVFDRTFSVLA